MKLIKRIIFFFSLFLIYIIFRELVELYIFAKSFHPVAGYLTLSTLAVLIIYTIIIPIYKIIKIPRAYAPATERNEIQSLIEKRIDSFKKNPYLLKSNYNFENLATNEENYNRIISELEKESLRIRKKYVSQLFYSTSISQNGFLDAILILSASVNLVKEIFILYNGRVSNRDLWAIAKKVYYSVAIGGSEGVEYAIDEIFSKLGTESMKSIPFADKILGSVADGFVNAALLTRISLITENYCKLLFLEKERDLYPSAKFVITSTTLITSHIIDNIKKSIVKVGIEKAESMAKYFANPIAYLFGKAKENESLEIQNPDDELLLAQGNSVGYGITKLFSSFWKKK